MILKADHLGKSYQKGGRSIQVIDDLSLEVERGDFLSIIGPSGSGKSTLLLMLSGMLPPSSGEVWVEGEPIYQLPIKERTKLRTASIALMFQTFQLIPYLTALQNVEIPLMLKGLSRDAQKERATELLESVGLSHRVSHKPWELSVGQQQRLAFARTIACGPSIILADEPTGNLDPEMGQELLRLLLELNQGGTTLVMVTHDHGIAAMANKTYSLSPQPS